MFSLCKFSDDVSLMLHESAADTWNTGARTAEETIEQYPSELSGTKTTATIGDDTLTANQDAINREVNKKSWLVLFVTCLVIIENCSLSNLILSILVLLGVWWGVNCLLNLGEKRNSIFLLFVEMQKVSKRKNFD